MIVSDPLHLLKFIFHIPPAQGRQRLIQGVQREAGSTRLRVILLKMYAFIQCMQCQGFLTFKHA